MSALIPLLFTALKLHGTLLLDGVEREALLTDSRIDVGFQAFKINATDGQYFEGSRLIITNNVKTTDQSIYVWLDVNCRPKNSDTGNAMIVIVDNLHGHVPVVSECALLEAVQ